MTVGTCEACGNEWETRRDPDDLTDPKCPECGERSDIEFSDDDGPVLKQQGRKDRLRDALSAVPGVGDAGVEYATMMYDMTDASEGPEELYAVVAEIEGVSDQQARRVADAVFQVSPDGRDPAPFDHGGDADDGGESFIDQLAKAREAGLLGNSGGAEGTITIQRDDGTTVEVPADHPAVEELVGGGDDGASDAEAIASAVSEAISPALNRMTQAMQDDDGGRSEVERLREEIEELREEKEREKVRRLEEKIEELEASADADDTEIAKLRESRKTLESAPEVSARAAEAWEDVLHGLMDRAKSLERQQAMMSNPRGGPSYTPPADGHGQPPSPREAAANGHAARQDRRAEPQENSQPTDHDTDDTNHMTDHNTDHDHDSTDDDSDVTAERQPEGVTEEKAAEVREKLGLSAGEDADGEEVSA